MGRSFVAATGWFAGNKAYIVSRGKAGRALAPPRSAFPAADRSGA
jgi:hypothetical protein